ncbi:MAG: DNA-3-methyladenine glycosylase 2 family protein [Nitrospirae bacterium]|nr:DNA-3-methyladenine glycosylase 2 family protein [Nitrospirota bacterium]
MALLRTDRRGDRRRGRSAHDNHAPACRHLATRDPVLRGLIARIGPCRLTPRRHHFATLCDSIIAQQLSTRVAEVIFDRFAGLYPQRRPTPQAVVQTPLPRLHSVGLSGQKARYLKDLAAGFLDGRIRPSRLPRQSNEEIIEALVSIHGVGRWTAEMFLIFSLNRSDVLPVDDLGIKKAIQRWYGLRALPSPAKIRAIGSPWHPYESIASWYLWRSLHLQG